MKLIKIALDIPLNKTFDYLPGKFDGQVHSGTRVLVPFGNSKRMGWVVGFTEKRVRSLRYKKIIKVYDEKPLITEELLELAKYVSGQYFSSLGQALAAITKSFALKKVCYERQEFSPVSGLILPQEYSEITNVLLQKQFNTIFLLFKKEFYKEHLYSQLVDFFKFGSCLLLFPEVTKAEKFYRKFHEIFGEKVILFHSELSKKKKTVSWERMLYGKNQVVIGTRIGVFSPLSDLGMIIIDEGNNFSFQEKQTPKYNAVKLAEWRAKNRNIPLVTGENCFSLEEYLNIVKKKKVSVFEIPSCVVHQPEIHVVQVRKSNIYKRLPFFSLETLSVFEEFLLKNKKIAVVHSRKGTAKILVCEKCNYKFLCNICGSSMISSEDKKTMFCRFCGSSLPFPEKCGQCGSKKVIMKTFGLEKMEKMLKKMYPDVKIFKKTAEEKNLVIPENWQIVIGTSSVEEVLDKVSVDLLIFPNGDSFFNVPDFRAEERFFLTVNNFLKRMKSEKAKVIIQTFNSGLPIYKSLKQNNPEIFYDKEIKIRKQLNYPPFSDVVKIEMEAGSKKFLETKKNNLEKLLKEKNLPVFYAGPSFPPVRKGHYLWKYILMVNAVDIFGKLHGLVGKIPFSIEINPEKI